MPSGKLRMFKLYDMEGNLLIEDLSSKLAEYINQKYGFYVTPYAIRQAEKKKYNMCKMFTVEVSNKEYMATCEVCGKKYPTDFVRSHFCSEECRQKCEEERKKEYAKPKNERSYNKGKRYDDSNIITINQKAKAMGMSYGQYKAMLYMEGVRH